MTNQLSHRYFQHLLAYFSCLYLTCPGVLAVAADIKYPIILDDGAQSQRIGIAVDWPWSGMKPFRYRCFYYGDGGSSISFSDEFFASYRSKGFTIDTACLGLQASISYDPENGQHLPTYVAGNIRLKYPLSLRIPSCFKSGDPLRDCDLNYNPETGKPLTPQQIKELHDLDDKIRAMIEFAEINLNYCGRATDCTADTVEDGSRQITLNTFWDYLPEQVKNAGGPTTKFDDVSALVESTGFWPAAVYINSRLPGGYGILFNADGSAGEVPSPAEVAAALNGVKMASQLTTEELAKLLEQQPAAERK